MLNPGAVVTLAFKKMLYNNLRKMGSRISPVPALCKKGKKAAQRVVFLV